MLFCSFERFINLILSFLSVAMATKENLHLQKNFLNNITQTMNSFANRFPIVNSLIQRANIRKRRDSIVLAAVIATCCHVGCLSSGGWNDLSAIVSRISSLFCFTEHEQRLCWGMMCPGYASVPQTTNQSSPCKCPNMGKHLLPPCNSTEAFYLFWSPDQIRVLPARHKGLSPSLPEGRKNTSAFFRTPPRPFPPWSPDQLLP
ncbi:GOSR1 [Acanthosepion pharaonis]|uniref:Golgi SNAP receptor complex member 1 n=1 Tax=Acanthosepion pharaonis TaxID=158019 RepID=A0A812D1N5_ACAPH|nr:GOSR1 [Sepia pharaonis]